MSLPKRSITCSPSVKINEIHYQIYGHQNKFIIITVLDPIDYSQISRQIRSIAETRFGQADNN